MGKGDVSSNLRYGEGRRRRHLHDSSWNYEGESSWNYEGQWQADAWRDSAGDGWEWKEWEEKDRHSRRGRH